MSPRSTLSAEVLADVYGADDSEYGTTEFDAGAMELETADSDPAMEVVEDTPTEVATEDLPLAQPESFDVVEPSFASDPPGDDWQPLPEGDVIASPVGGLTVGERDPATSTDETAWTAPRLTQGQLSDRPGDGDCFLIASLNRIAESPGGMDHLRSQVTDVGEGFYEVTLRDSDNRPSTILLQHPHFSDSGIPAANAPATGDWTLRLYERAMAVHNDPTLAYSTDQTPESVYRNSRISAGGYPHVAMQQLGLDLDDSGVHPDVALERHRANPEHPVVMSTFERFLPGEETYGLSNSHAYELEREVRMPGADDPFAVLRDPRNGERTYVPSSELRRVVQYGSQGRIPGR